MGLHLWRFGDMVSRTGVGIGYVVRCIIVERCACTSENQPRLVSEYIVVARAIIEREFSQHETPD